MSTTAAIDRAERDTLNADAARRAKHWLIRTLALLAIAYFLPLRWAMLLALLYAAFADPELNLGGLLRNLPIADAPPFPFPFRPPWRKTVYATSVVLKDETSGETLARLHKLASGHPAVSFYDERGNETEVFESRLFELVSERLDTAMAQIDSRFSAALLEIRSTAEQLKTKAEFIEAETSEIEELRNALAQFEESINTTIEEVRSYDDDDSEQYWAHQNGVLRALSHYSRVQRALDHDTLILLEAVKRIDPDAIKTMEEIRSYNEAASERYYAHQKGEHHWSDYEPSVKRLESEILRLKGGK